MAPAPRRRPRDRGRVRWTAGEVAQPQPGDEEDEERGDVAPDEGVPDELTGPKAAASDRGGRQQDGGGDGPQQPSGRQVQGEGEEVPGAVAGQQDGVVEPAAGAGGQVVAGVGHRGEGEEGGGGPQQVDPQVVADPAAQQVRPGPVDGADGEEAGEEEEERHPQEAEGLVERGPRGVAESFGGGEEDGVVGGDEDDGGAAGRVDPVQTNGRGAGRAGAGGHGSPSRWLATPQRDHGSVTGRAGSCHHRGQWSKSRRVSGTNGHVGSSRRRRSVAGSSHQASVTSLGCRVSGVPSQRAS